MLGGGGKGLEAIYDALEAEETIGTVDVVAVIDSKREVFRGRECVKPEMLKSIDYDYVVISTMRFFGEIQSKLKEQGVEDKKIIDYRIFLEDGFDFEEYVENDWINNRVVMDSVFDTSCLDESRLLRGKNVNLLLGRMSYIGGLIFEYLDCYNKYVLTIGNYTSISSDIIIEIGSNLDHDYHCITNFGLSHLLSREEVIHEMRNKEYSAVIGSDCWIGRHSRIKGSVHIGNGAVIASNSYVVSDVPDYAIVGGNPARLIKYRFDKDIVNDLCKTEWWKMSKKELVRYRECFNDPIRFIERIKEDKKKNVSR